MMMNQMFQNIRSGSENILNNSSNSNTMMNNNNNSSTNINNNLNGGGNIHANSNSNSNSNANSNSNSNAEEVDGEDDNNNTNKNNTNGDNNKETPATSEETEATASSSSENETAASPNSEVETEAETEEEGEAEAEGGTSPTDDPTSSSKPESTPDPASTSTSTPESTPALASPLIRPKQWWNGIRERAEGVMSNNEGILKAVAVVGEPLKTFASSPSTSTSSGPPPPPPPTEAKDEEDDEDEDDDKKPKEEDESLEEGAEEPKPTNNNTENGRKDDNNKEEEEEDDDEMYQDQDIQPPSRTDSTSTLASFSGHASGGQWWTGIRERAELLATEGIKAATAAAVGVGQRSVHGYSTDEGGESSKLPQITEENIKDIPLIVLDRTLQELQQLKKVGITTTKRRKKELDQLSKLKNAKARELWFKDYRAKRHIPFHEYKDMMKKRSLPAHDTSNATLSMEAKVVRAQFHCLVTERQRDVQQRVHREMIEHLWSILPNIRQEKELAELVGTNQVDKMRQSKDVMVETYEEHLGVQRKIIAKLHLRELEHEEEIRKFKKQHEHDDDDNNNDDNNNDKEHEDKEQNDKDEHTDTANDNDDHDDELAQKKFALQIASGELPPGTAELRGSAERRLLARQEAAERLQKRKELQSQKAAARKEQGDVMRESDHRALERASAHMETIKSAQIRAGLVNNNGEDGGDDSESTTNTFGDDDASHSGDEVGVVGHHTKRTPSVPVVTEALGEEDPTETNNDEEDIIGNDGVVVVAAATTAAEVNSKHDEAVKGEDNASKTKKDENEGIIGDNCVALVVDKKDEDNLHLIGEASNSSSSSSLNQNNESSSSLSSSTRRSRRLRNRASANKKDLVSDLVSPPVVGKNAVVGMTSPQSTTVEAERTASPERDTAIHETVDAKSKVTEDNMSTRSPETTPKGKVLESPPESPIKFMDSPTPSPKASAAAQVSETAPSTETAAGVGATTTTRQSILEGRRNRRSILDRATSARRVSSITDQGGEGELEGAAAVRPSVRAARRSSALAERPSISTVNEGAIGARPRTRTSTVGQRPKARSTTRISASTSDLPTPDSPGARSATGQPSITEEGVGSRPRTRTSTVGQRPRTRSTTAGPGDTPTPPDSPGARSATGRPSINAGSLGSRPRRASTIGQRPRSRSSTTGPAANSDEIKPGVERVIKPIARSRSEKNSTPESSAGGAERVAPRRSSTFSGRGGGAMQRATSVRLRSSGVAGRGGSRADLLQRARSVRLSGSTGADKSTTAGAASKDGMAQNDDIAAGEDT